MFRFLRLVVTRAFYESDEEIGNISSSSSSNSLASVTLISGQSTEIPDGADLETFEDEEPVDVQLDAATAHASDVYNELEQNGLIDLVYSRHRNRTTIKTRTKPKWLPQRCENPRQAEEEKNKLPNSWVSLCDSEDDHLMIDENGTERKDFRKSDACKCHNCTKITEISDCGVCFEPLQTRGVSCCSNCGNIVCSRCAPHLRICAFCRSTSSMQRNRAFERLLGVLSLPCRNTRNGCPKLVKKSMRLRHEAYCRYAPASCPVLGGETCRWEGTPAMVLSHLEQEHNIKPLESCGISFRVKHFQSRCRSGWGSCTVYLTWEDQLFIIKVMTLKKRLFLELVRYGYVGSEVQEEQDRTKWAGYVKLWSMGTRKCVKGLVPFKCDTREIEVNLDKLYPVNTKMTDLDCVDLEITMTKYDIN